MSSAVRTEVGSLGGVASLLASATGFTSSFGTSGLLKLALTVSCGNAAGSFPGVASGVSLAGKGGGNVGAELPAESEAGMGFGINLPGMAAGERHGSQGAGVQV